MKRRVRKTTFKNLYTFWNEDDNNILKELSHNLLSKMFLYVLDGVSFFWSLIVLLKRKTARGWYSIILFQNVTMFRANYNIDSIVTDRHCFKL